MKLKNSKAGETLAHAVISSSLLSPKKAAISYIAIALCVEKLSMKLLKRDRFFRRVKWEQET